MRRLFAWLPPVLAALVFVFTHFVWRDALPAENVATHFDGAGQANGWMTRTGHEIFILGTGLGVAAFVLGLCHAIRLLPSRLLNVPQAAFWRSPLHYPAACEKIAAWGRWFAAGLLVYFTMLNGLVIQANRIQPPRLDGTLLGWTSGIFVFLVLASILWLVRSFARRPL
jgi:hypothetical protein